jgi:hypothetical protein
MQSFINQQNSYNQTINAGLQKAGADLQKTFPVFEYDMGMAGNADCTPIRFGCTLTPVCLGCAAPAVSVF